MENEIWDEGQLGAVEGVLGTVDQLIIDRCIMEEVKQYHRSLAVAFYDYKKGYDKVHHDWMLRVYHWIGIPKEVITLISQLMEKWKTRLEIWSRGEKLTSRWLTFPVGSCKETAILQLAFVSQKYRFVCYCNKVKVTGWTRLDVETSAEHIACLLMTLSNTKKIMKHLKM